MTLTTHLRVVDPLVPADVFTYCRNLIGAYDGEVAYRHDTNHGWSRYRNLPGQGMPAILTVAYCDDGPLPDFAGTPFEAPAGAIEVMFDTGYGYRDEYGECDDLHRRLTTQLGQWLDDQGTDWWCQDEYDGAWHRRTPCPLADRKVAP